MVEAVCKMVAHLEIDLRGRESFSWCMLPFCDYQQAERTVMVSTTIGHVVPRSDFNGKSLGQTVQKGGKEQCCER